MLVQVELLRPNPFRHLSRYPVQREKIDALKQSIKDTSFWDNLLARKANGGYEIAYGHNRLAALKELGYKQVDIPVRDLDNTAMARIMAKENQEEWSGTSAIEHETVRSIVEAYGAGKIELRQPGLQAPRAKIRHAPRFVKYEDVRDSSAEHPYTVETLQEFLGWKLYKIKAALAALELIETEVATEQDFTGLSSKQAAVVVTQTQRALRAKPGKPKLAKQVAQHLADGFRSDGKTSKLTGNKVVTIHTAREEADKIIGVPSYSDKQIELKAKPDLEEFAQKLFRKISAIFSGELKEKITAVLKVREHLSEEKRQSLLNALRDVERLVQGWVKQLEDK